MPSTSNKCQVTITLNDENPSLNQHLPPTFYNTSQEPNITNTLTSNLDNYNYLGIERPQITPIENIDTYNVFNSLDSMNIGSNYLEKSHNVLKDTGLNSYHNAETEGFTRIENNSISKDMQKVSITPKKKNIGSLISSTLNLLDDEEMLEHLSQESNSDQSSVKNLSLTRNQSICSVVSLDKTYKNLDCSSFKNTYKIPQGNDFLELFKNYTSKKVKPVALSTEFGEIGFNVKYSDYIKGLGRIEDQTAEEKEAIRNILNMYPKENSVAMQKRLFK